MPETITAYLSVLKFKQESEMAKELMSGLVRKEPDADSIIKIAKELIAEDKSLSMKEAMTMAREVLK